MLGLETDVLLVSSDFLYFLTGGLRPVKEGSEAIRCSFMMYFSLSTALGMPWWVLSSFMNCA